jgi:hypothetical protein
MVGKEVAWPIPVSRINKGGMVRTQAVTLTDEPARSRYAIYPRSPKQENIAEQMLAPTEPRDWLRTVVAGDLVKARGIIRKVELKPDVQDWVFKDGRHGTITEYQWWVELSPGHVEPAK